MEYTIFYVLGALFIIYLLISIYNKKNARERRGRKFMGDYEAGKGRHRTKNKN